MLVPFVPAAAAEETAARPTVEEILGQYHQAAFEAEMNGEESAAYSPRSGSNEPTLEQQTLETLNEAGYEAYNVTADNYDTLEEQLQTDFADMGLDPEGSYIIVIHGEEEQAQNGNARLDDILLPPHPWEDDNGNLPNTFSYTYNGTTYRMRYVTVASTDMSVLSQLFAFSVKRNSNEEIWNTVLDAAITFAKEEVLQGTTISDVRNLSGGLFSANEYSVLDCNGFLITGCTTWTLQYVQVYDYSTYDWITAQCSEFAVTSAQTQFYLYDDALKTHIPHAGELFSFTTYSEYYNNSDYRKISAVQVYLSSLRICALDYTGYIKVCVNKLDTNTAYYICGNINDDTNVSNIFIRDHWTNYD